MAMPPRLRSGPWPRLIPRILMKTSVLILGLLIWVLYFYSNNYTYQRRLPLEVRGEFRKEMSVGRPKAAPEKEILRRPTVPLFEGPVEPEVTQTTMLNQEDDSGVVSDSPFGTLDIVHWGDNHLVLQNFLPSRLRFGYGESVTLTTHGTYELLDNVVSLSKHWKAPISVAVYAPNHDFQVSLDYSQWLRQCHQTVADYVSFHFVFPEHVALSTIKAFMQNAADSDGLDAKPIESPNGTFPGFESQSYDYIKVAKAFLASHAQVSPSNGESLLCHSQSYSLPLSYRHRYGLPYPINVCRNVARRNAKTHFVLASDIELYPSADVVPMFLNFSKRLGIMVQKPVSQLHTDPVPLTGNSAVAALASFFLQSIPSRSPKPRVYVLPIFEVDKTIKDVPSTKSILVDLYRRKKAVYFHKYVCSFCNIIPKLNKWLTTPASKNKLNIFLTIKRHKPFNRWEPIYIGTNDDPLYDEGLTWEGQQDKMTQVR